MSFSIFDIDQGWILVISSGLITLLGCCVICLDQLYKVLFPRTYALKPFKIQNDKEFLVCSLALSSGCLLFTSLYKLLPESNSYLKQISKLKHNKSLLNGVEFSFYFGGIVICAVLNLIVHLFTSESLVHCAHDGEGDEEIDSANKHHQSHEILHASEHSHNHSHNHSHYHDDAPDTDHSHALAHSSMTNSYTNNLLGSSNEFPIKSSEESLEPIKVTETHVVHAEPMSHHTKAISEKSRSLMDLSLKALKGESLSGDCYGDLEECATDIIAHSKKLNGQELHFCTRPTEENILFVNQDHLITNKEEFNKKYPHVNINSPLLEKTNKLENNYGSAGYFPSDTNSLNKVHHHDEEHSAGLPRHDSIEEVQHHHHIKTPFSRLLSIGIQTIVAVTLHKFPEGFIMYATSKANPELGIMIFISMFIHNFVEGFTMTLPIYVAIGSRWKSILISGTLGGFAQPIGALIGWFTFRGNMDMNNTSTIFLIGNLLALTSGFLTFIALQMFASSIGFGGKQEIAVKWAFLGIFLICLSNILI